MCVRSVNISMGVKEDRNLITGLHTVADVYCNSCQTVLGWKYVSSLWRDSVRPKVFAVRERRPAVHEYP